VWDDNVTTEAEVAVRHLDVPGNDHPPIMLRPLGVERVVVGIWGPTEESGEVFVEGDLDEVVVSFFPGLFNEISTLTSRFWIRRPHGRWIAENTSAFPNIPATAVAASLVLGNGTHRVDRITEAKRQVMVEIEPVNH